MSRHRLVTACSNCSTEAADAGCSLPVDNNCDYVAVANTTTEWGAVPACRACFNLHAASGPFCNDVLRVYAKIVETREQSLDTARDALRELEQRAGKAFDDIREL